MMPGRPGGKQFAADSSGGAPGCALALAAYSGVSEGPGPRSAPRPRPAPAAEPRPAGGAPARPPALGFGEAAPRPPPPPNGVSHTPVKSGSLAIAAQSSALGAACVNFCADAGPLLARQAANDANTTFRRFVIDILPTVACSSTRLYYQSPPFDTSDLAPQRNAYPAGPGRCLTLSASRPAARRNRPVASLQQGFEAGCSARAATRTVIGFFKLHQRLVDDLGRDASVLRRCPNGQSQGQGQNPSLQPYSGGPRKA